MEQVIERPLLLIAGHGERGGAGDNARLASIAGKAGDLLADWYVRHGVLSGSPSIEEALEAAGRRPVLVWPFFMCRGYFVDIALRRRIEAADVDYDMLPELGSSPLLVETACRMLIANGSPVGGHVLVVAHGSGKGPESRLSTERFSRALANADGIGHVSCAFLEEPPFAAGQIAALPSGSALVSLFAGDGLHGGQDMAALIAESCRHDLNVVCPAVDIDAAVRFLTGTVASYMSDSFPARRYGARRAGAF